MEIVDITRNLNRIKNTKELWDEFKYSECDNNLKRHTLAIALQYDDISDSLELVRFLMENEIKSRRNDPFQGFGNSLILISYLLSKFKMPENVWLFEEAKVANFDTFCGYDSEFIFSAGVDATCYYLESYQISDNNKYLFEIKDNLRNVFTEEHINEFLNSMKVRFPDNLKDECIHTFLLRAIEFSNFDEAHMLFPLYEKEKKDDFNNLYYYAKKIRNYDKAIYYQNKILRKAKNAWDKVSALHNLADIHCLKTDFISAYKMAKEWNKVLGKFKDWKQTGLGRMLTETWFDICLGLIRQKNIQLSLRCFTYGEEMIKNITWCTFCIYEKAQLCAEKLGLTDKDKYYSQMMQEEKKRIDEELGKTF